MNPQTALKKQFCQITEQLWQTNNKLCNKKDTLFRLEKTQLHTPSEQTLNEEYQTRQAHIIHLQQEINKLQKEIEALEKEKNKIGEEIEQQEEA